MVKRIAVLISNKGTGSNLSAILQALEAKKIKNGQVVVVVSDKKDAYGLITASKKNIPTEVLTLKSYKNFKVRKKYDIRLAQLLKKKYKVDLVVLAGWMIILGKNFIKYFPNRVINLHPGLLPDRGEYVTLSDGTKLKAIRGLHTDAAVQYAIDNHYKATGSTVHFITTVADNGPVILRTEVKIRKSDSVDSLFQRMKKEEHKILPMAIDLYCNDKLDVRNGTVIIKS